ncbi:MAG: PAS domain S-box protein [Deltaproteobacteria bacterium]|nr:PAS domain S-box protein [Deltaproteobacteria bacterium]
MRGLILHHPGMLQEIEDKYRSFFESIEQGYYEIDKKGYFTFFNDFICRITGYTEDELMGMNVKELAEPQDRKTLYGVFKEIYLTEKPRIGLVFAIKRKDGIKRQVGASICLIKDTRGRGAGFRGIARDISDRKLIEKRLKQAQKMEAIGKLAAGIAHEINSPIQYTSDNVRFLLESFSTINDVMVKYHMLFEALIAGKDVVEITRETASLIEESDLEYLNREIPMAISQSLEGLNHVSKIISAMKTFSHPGSGEKKYTDINRAIQNTIAITKNEWKYFAEMRTDFDESLPLVPCVADEFQQVILNLIINASQAIKDMVGDGSNGKGEIRVKTLYKEPWAEVGVSDTGTGIPDDIKPRIFDPFFTTKEVGLGSGQGLAIAYNIITNRHGGTIECAAVKDRGATMIVRIPLAPCRVKDESLMDIPSSELGKMQDERKDIVCR